jgi:hypothetical protein
MSRISLLAAVVVAAMFAATASADAACTSSTPSAAAYADPVDGELGLAPEITTVKVSVDASCRYVVDPGIATPLADGDGVFVYIDTDGNPATGAADIGGADVAIVTVGLGTTVSPPLRGVWDGQTFVFDATTPAGTSVGNGGFSASVDALAIASGATTNVVLGSLRVTEDDVLFDLAPDAGAISLPVIWSAAAPATKRTDLYTAQAPAAAACTVPRTKGMTVARARARVGAPSCTVGTVVQRAYSASVKRGRVVDTSIAAGRAARGTVRLVVSKGKRPRKAHKADANPVLARAGALVAADVRRHAAG